MKTTADNFEKGGDGKLQSMPIGILRSTLMTPFQKDGHRLREASWFPMGPSGPFKAQPAHWFAPMDKNL
jgi:hypothetical protein